MTELSKLQKYARNGFEHAGNHSYIEQVPQKDKALCREGAPKRGENFMRVQ